MSVENSSLSPPSPFRLAQIAHGRSGDKGNHANIGIIAYTAAGYAWLKSWLTRERVHEHFQVLRPSKVERFEAENLLAFNFLLYNTLAGGASRSLRTDSQGKTLALSLLQMEIEPPPNWQQMIRVATGPLERARS